MDAKDKIEGYLEVGANDKGEVVMNYEIDILRDLDSENRGHFTFSPNQACGLGLTLFRQARIAEAPDWQHHDDIPKALADDIFGVFSKALSRMRQCLDQGDKEGITKASESVKFDDVENLIRAAIAEKNRMSEEGEKIPPIKGDPPCDEYDPAGKGAGLEYDGHPQCAQCGWPKAVHVDGRIRELNQRLCMPGPKCCGLSASEVQEIADFIDQINQPKAPDENE